jgi:hypothetical protein
MNKLICDICGKAHETLGSYGDDNWWICLKCFEEADALAAEEDRWPDERDFKSLQKRSSIK